MPTYSKKSISKEVDGSVRLCDHSYSHVFGKQLTVSNRHSTPSVDSFTSLKVNFATNRPLIEGSGEILSDTHVQPLGNDSLALESDTLACHALVLSHQTLSFKLSKGVELAIIV
ncbi:hypothetical protein AMTRI_Chr08g209170 [Amborella trichopoda]